MEGKKRPRGAGGLEFATAVRMIAAMFRHIRFLATLLFAALAATLSCAAAQDAVPGAAAGYGSPPAAGGAVATSQVRDLSLKALLTEKSASLPGGVVWRVFDPEPGAEGKLRLIETREGGDTRFSLPPGTYLIHAAFGRAGATKKVTLGNEPREETLVLDAGGLMLNATLSGNVRIPSDNLKFSIYDGIESANGERKLIIPDVTPNSIVRLNAGTYHVVSTYGTVNAVIRSDIRVEAGKLTTATVEHRAAQIVFKLVRERGGEAIADTQWSILTDSGDIVKESVAAFASVVLAEGNYTVIAKNKDRIFQRDFDVVAGRNQDVEVIAVE